MQNSCENWWIRQPNNRPWSFFIDSLKLIMTTNSWEGSLHSSGVTWPKILHCWLQTTLGRPVWFIWNTSTKVLLQTLHNGARVDGRLPSQKERDLSCHHPLRTFVVHNQGQWGFGRHASAKWRCLGQSRVLQGIQQQRKNGPHAWFKDIWCSFRPKWSWQVPTWPAARQWYCYAPSHHWSCKFPAVRTYKAMFVTLRRLWMRLDNVCCVGTHLLIVTG